VQIKESDAEKSKSKSKGVGALPAPAAAALAAEEEYDHDKDSDSDADHSTDDEKTDQNADGDANGPPGVRFQLQRQLSAKEAYALKVLFLIPYIVVRHICLSRAAASTWGLCSRDMYLLCSCGMCLPGR